MASINPVYTRRQMTAKAYFKRSTGTQFINIGDVTAWQMPPDLKRTPILESAKGFRRQTRELITEVAWKYELTVNEITKENLEFLNLGTSAADVVQTSGTGLTASFASVAYRGAYPLNAESVSAVVVKNAANTVTYVLGVDYDVDLDTGVIQIYDTGAIAEASTINVTYNRAATTRGQVNALKEFFVAGALKLHCFDQHDGRAIETHDVSNAQLYVIDWGTSDGSKILEIKMRAMCVTEPVITYRK